MRTQRVDSHQGNQGSKKTKCCTNLFSRSESIKLKGPQESGRDPVVNHLNGTKCHVYVAFINFKADTDILLPRITHSIHTPTATDARDGSFVPYISLEFAFVRAMSAHSDP